MRKTLIQTLLAAFCAILATAPLEGGGMILIGMRNAMLSGGKHTPTAKDYVQDGLFAMWDGIENAGWGVHDSSAQGWTNLVTGAVSPLVNSIGSFKDNRFASGDGGGVNIGLYNDIRTIELVVARFGGSYCIVTPDKDATNQSISPMNIIYVSGVGYVPNRANSGCRVAFEDYRTPHTVSFTRANTTDTTVTTYGDGVLSTGALYNDWWTVSKGYIAYVPNSRWANLHCYSLRFYSRALTADEIAANHAVDKARFNLPDAT